MNGHYSLNINSYGRQNGYILRQMQEDGTWEPIGYLFWKPNDQGKNPDNSDC